MAGKEGEKRGGWWKCRNCKRKERIWLEKQRGCNRADLWECECLPPWLLCRLSQALRFVRSAKVHKSYRRSFFGRAPASHPRQPLQASSHPLFICEGRLTHPAQLHTYNKPGPRSYGGGRTRTHAHTNGYSAFVDMIGWQFLAQIRFCHSCFSKIWKQWIWFKTTVTEWHLCHRRLKSDCASPCKCCYMGMPTLCQVERRRVDSFTLSVS